MGREAGTRRGYDPRMKSYKAGDTCVKGRFSGLGIYICIYIYIYIFPTVISTQTQIPIPTVKLPTSPSPSHSPQGSPSPPTIHPPTNHPIHLPLLFPPHPLPIPNSLKYESGPKPPLRLSPITRISARLTHILPIHHLAPSLPRSLTYRSSIARPEDPGPRVLACDRALGGKDSTWLDRACTVRRTGCRVGHPGRLTVPHGYRVYTCICGVGEG